MDRCKMHLIFTLLLLPLDSLVPIDFNCIAHFPVLQLSQCLSFMQVYRCMGALEILSLPHSFALFVAAALLVVAAPLAGGCAGCAQLVLEPVAALAFWTLGSLLTAAELLSFLMNLLLLLLVLTTLPPCYSKNHEYLSSIKNLSSI